MKNEEKKIEKQIALYAPLDAEDSDYFGQVLDKAFSDLAANRVGGFVVGYLRPDGSYYVKCCGSSYLALLGLLSAATHEVNIERSGQVEEKEDE